MRKTITVFFILGVLFRLWISHLIPQPFVFDQTEYHNFALQMLERGLNAWQSRLYGYPLFLAVIYKIFGPGNFTAVAVIQSVVDCLTAVLIFATAQKIFKNQKIAWLSYILYLFNPFTSVFTILTLSEVWGIFLLMGMGYLTLRFVESASSGINFSTHTESAEVGHDFFPHLPLRAQKAWPPRRFFFIALLLGYLPQVRPVFLIYCVILILGLIVWTMKEKGMMKGIMMATLFFLPFIYNIAGNWVYFRQFSLTTVDNLFVREFFISVYMPDRFSNRALYPPQVQEMYNEYTFKPQNKKERQAMADKYLALSFRKIGENPQEFIASRLAKMWYGWEKHKLFLYNQPQNSVVDFLTYWGNNLLIFLAVLGFAGWVRLKRSKISSVWAGVMVFTIIYLTFSQAFTAAEERYTLPGYPLLFLFAGYGMYKLAGYCILPINKS